MSLKTNNLHSFAKKFTPQFYHIPQKRLTMMLKILDSNAFTQMMAQHIKKSIEYEP